MTDFRCADESLARDEPMFATASGVQRWLLVEQNRPFSAESVPAGRISAAALNHLAQMTTRFAGRLMMIRRPPALPPEAGLRVFYADSRPGHEGLVSMLVTDEPDLCGLSLDDPRWSPIHEALYLVCTHGKHDPCCAVLGRPVVAALTQSLDAGRVWECSHVGGDRFAGNVVALPSGLYLGRVEPDEASAVVELIEAGRVPVHYLRGRSSLAPQAQAAQHFARTSGGYGSFDGIGDLLPLELRLSPADGPAATAVTLACPTGDVTVTVRRITSPMAVQLTCHVDQPKYYPSFELVRVVAVAPDVATGEVSTTVR